MNAIKPGDIALRLHLHLLRLQAADKLACLACGAAVLGWLWLVPSQRDALERSKATLGSERAALAHLPMTPVAFPVSSNTRNLDAFHAALASHQNPESHLGTIFSAARESRVAWVKSEYKLDYNVPSRTWAYQIVMPVTGSYSGIRRFCEKVLAQLPFAALDEISFRRDAVGAGALEARLHFSLHLDADLPHARSAPAPLTPTPHARGQQSIAAATPADAAKLPGGVTPAVTPVSTPLPPKVGFAPDMRLAALPADPPRARSAPAPLAPTPHARGQQSIAAAAPADAAKPPGGVTPAATPVSAPLPPKVGSAPDMRLASLTLNPPISEAALRAILFR